MTEDQKLRCHVLTPPGTGAIAIVRVVGDGAADLVSRLFRPSQASSPPLSSKPTPPCGSISLHYGLIEVAGETIDDVIVSQVAGGTEPAVDICTHGGVRVVERLLETLAQLGAVFTPREQDVPDLFHSSSLIELEAIELLSRVTTRRGVKFIARQRAHLPPAIRALGQIAEKAPDEVGRRLQKMLDGYAFAQRLVDGAVVAIVGPPNSGKSTLFNHLIGRAASIVSPQAGTTRDWVSATIELDGIPITLVDTAGIHDQAEGMERVAIEFGRRRWRSADLLLCLADVTKTRQRESELADQRNTGLPSVVLNNKIDLLDLRRGDDPVSSGRQRVPGSIDVSASTGLGIDEVVSAVSLRLGVGRGTDEAVGFFTSRQCEVAEKSLSDLRLGGIIAEAVIGLLLFDG